MDLTEKEVEILQAAQGPMNVLVLSDANQGPRYLKPLALNAWAIEMIAIVRAKWVAEANARAMLYQNEYVDMKALYEQKVKDFEEYRRMVDDITSKSLQSFGASDALKQAQWEKSAGDAGGPYKAHKTTDGWTVVDCTSTIVIWDANGSGLMFCPEPVAKQLAAEWNLAGK